MKNRLLTASAVVCTLSVLSMICLGQIKKNHSISPLAAANVEALTEDEESICRTCFEEIVEIAPGDPLFAHAYAVQYCSDCKWHIVIDYTPGYHECWD